MTADKPSIFSLSQSEIEDRVRALQWPTFRARQLGQWVFQKQTVDPQAMTDFSLLQRNQLAEVFDFSAGNIAADQVSEDGTRKLLLRWGGKDEAETVMIPDGVRRTACISSQVGCPVGCRFCASGVNGSSGNLKAGQIVQQVWQLNQLMTADRINHIVLMGMGEPLANYSQVMKAIRILHDPMQFNIGARKITLSTVGVPSRMRQLAEEGLQINLAISLHAPNEKLRLELIPWAEHFSIGEILAAGQYFFEKTGREITLEYILLAGVNDRPEHARQLAGLCKPLRANVNLIRYNEVADLPYSRPASEDVMTFQSILRNNGVNAHVRKSRGRDISAACGQLRRSEKPKALPLKVGVSNRAANVPNGTINAPDGAVETSS